MGEIRARRTRYRAGFAVLFMVVLMIACAAPTPTATPQPTPTDTPTPLPTLTLTATPSPTLTSASTPTATFTPTYTATPTKCSVAHAVTATPGIQAVEISSKELAKQLPKSINQQGVSLKSVSTTIHPEGIYFQACVELTGIGALTATATMSARAEEDVIVLSSEDLVVEGAPDATMEALARALFQRLLEDPQWTRVPLPYGRAHCVELQEGYLVIAVLWHTPTPTNTPIPPQALATMFPSNPVYGLISLAKAGASITPHASYDRDTNFLLGLDGTISFPEDYRGSVTNLLLQSLDSRLTNGMVLRNQGENLEEYCNCVMGLRLGEMTADICWYAGKYPDGLHGKIFTRLGVIGARVSPEFYRILEDFQRLSGR